MDKLHSANDLAALYQLRTIATGRELREAQDRADFEEACACAEAKGDRALELLSSPECNPYSPLFAYIGPRAQESDYQVKGSK